MSINKNFKYKIYWKQIILITSLIISISVTMLYAATTNKNIILEYDADATLSGHSSQIILTSKNGKQLILQKLNQGNSVISNTDETNGRICFKTSGSVDNYICFVNNENNISMLEWQGLQGENGLFATQPAISIDALTGKMQYRDKGENKWHFFDDIANVAIDYSFGNKDQTLSENRTVFMNEKSLTFEGTDNSIIIDQTGNINVNGKTTLNDITLSGSLKVGNNTTSHYVAIETPINLDGNYTMTLPKDIGDSGQVLVTDGNEKTFWKTAVNDTSLGSNDQILNGLRTVDMNGNNLTFRGEKDIIINANGNFDIKGNATLEGNLQVTDAVAFKDNLDIYGNVTIDGSTILGNELSDIVRINGSLRIFNADGDKHVTIKSQNVIDNYTIAIPENNDNSDGVLTINSDETLGWESGLSDTNLGKDEQILKDDRLVTMNGKTLTFASEKNIIIDANGNLDIYGNAKVSNILQVKGAASLENKLIVEKETLLNNNLNVSGNTILGSDVEVTEAVNLDSVLNVNDNLIINGSTILGDNNDTTLINGSLKIVNDNNDFIIIKASDSAENNTLILPENSGDLGQALSTDGTGKTFWSFGNKDTNLGNTDQTLQSMRTVIMNEKKLTFNGTEDVVIDSQGSININGITVIADALEVIGNVNFDSTLNVEDNLIINGLSIILGNNDDDITIVNGDLKIANGSNHYITIKALDSFANYILSLPVNAGEQSQILSSDGDGKTSWAFVKSDTNLGDSDQSLQEARKIVMDNNNLIFNGTKNVVITANGNINIGGNANIGDNLEVAGTTLLKNTLKVNQGAFLNDNLHVLGDTTLEGNFEILGTANFENTLSISKDVTINGTTTLGNDNNDITRINGVFKLGNNSGGNYITIQAPDNMTSNYSFIIPKDIGSANEVLVSKGNGETMWKSAIMDTNLGNTDQSLDGFGLRIVNMNGNTLTFNGVNTKDIIIDENGNINVDQNMTIDGGLIVTGKTSLHNELKVEQITLLENNLNVSGNTSIGGSFEVLGAASLENTLNVTNNVIIDGSTNLGNDNNDITFINNSLKLNNNNGDYIIIKPPDSITDYIFNLPQTNGDNGDVLITDGHGNTSWWASSGIDTSISDNNQILEQSRTVNINGNNLIFEGTKDIIIDIDGNIDIGGNVTLNNGNLEVAGPANLKNKLIVEKAVVLNGTLNVSENTFLEGTFEVKGPVTLQNTLNVDGDVIIKGLTTLGDNNSDTIIIKGPLKFADNNGNYITMESPVFIPSNYTFVLPKNTGQDGEILALDADKRTFWTSDLSDINLGNNDQTLNAARLVNLDNNTLTFKGTKDIVIDNGNIDIGGNTTMGAELEVTGATNLKDMLIVEKAALFKTTLNAENVNLASNLKVTGISTFQNTLDVEEDLTVNGSTTFGDDNIDFTIINNVLRLADDGRDDYINIEVPSSVSSYTFLLPEDGGNNGDVLVTDGNGATSWEPILIDTSLSGTDQTLNEFRKVIMNGNKLTFNGAKDVVIDADGNININGDTRIKDTFQVAGAALLNNQLRVDGNTFLNDELQVLSNTSLGGILKVKGNTSLNTLNVTNDVTIDGSSTLGDNNDSTKIKGSLRISDNGNDNYITIKSPYSVSGYTLSLPENPGASSYALSSNGNGTTTWLSAGTDNNLGNVDQILSEMRMVYMDGKSLTFHGTGDVVIYDSGDINIDGSTTIGGNLQVTGETELQNILTVGSVSNFKDRLDVTGNTIIQGILNITGSATLANNLDVTGNATINGSTTLGDSNIKGSLKIGDNSAGNYITIKPPASLTDYTFILPQNKGNKDETLITNGNGVTFWGISGNDTNLGDTNQSLTENRTVTMSGYNLTFAGDGANNVVIYDNGNINVDGKGTVEGTFDVAGTTILQNTLIVAKETSLNNTLNILGDTDLGGTLKVTGIAALANNLDATGGATINGSTTLGDSNTDITSIKGSLKIADNSADNYITIGSSTTTGYTLVLPKDAGNNKDVLVTDGNGATKWAADASDTNLGNANHVLQTNRIVNMMGNNLTFNGTGNIVIYDSGNMDVDGKGTIGGTFEVAGTTVLNDELIVDQAASFGTTLNVKADSILTNTLKVTGVSTFENTLNVNSDVTINGSTVLGDSNSDITSIKGSFKIADDSSNNYITIKSPDSLSTNYTFVLPVDDGESDQILKTNGNGITSWISAINDTNLGNDNQTLNEERRVIIGDNDLIFQGASDIIYNNGNIDISGNGIIKGDFQAKGTTNLNDELTVNQGALFKATLSVTGPAILENDLQVIGASTLENKLDVKGDAIINGSTTIGDANSVTFINGSLKLADSDNSNYITIKSPDSLSTNYTFVLPLDGGQSNQILTYESDGKTVWKDLLIDTNLGNKDQFLNQNRTVAMNGYNLTFAGDGGNNVVIYDNGDMNVDGNGTIGGTLEVAKTTLFKDKLTVNNTVLLNNTLDVAGDTNIKGTFEETTGIVTFNNILNVTGNAIINGITILGNNNSDITTVNGTFKLADNDGNPNYITLSPSSSTTDDTTFTLPKYNGGGSGDHILVSNGNGDLSWQPDVSLDTNLGNTDQNLTENRIIIMDGNSLTFLGSQSIVIDQNGDIAMNGNVTVDGTLNVSGTVAFENTLETANEVILNNTFNVKGNTTVGSKDCFMSGKLTINDNFTIYDTIENYGSTVLGTDNSDTITIKGVLELPDGNNSTPHYIGIKAPSDIQGNYMFVFPETRGVSNQCLMTNSSGITSWEDPPIDTSLRDTDQIVTGNRTLDMAGYNLTFDGTNDVVFSDNGNIDIDGKVTIGGGLEVGGTTNFNDQLTVVGETFLENDLTIKGLSPLVEGETKIHGVGVFHKTLNVNEGIVMDNSPEGIQFYSKNNQKSIKIQPSKLISENSDYSLIFPKTMPPAGGASLTPKDDESLGWSVPHHRIIGLFGYHTNTCRDGGSVFVELFKHPTIPDVSYGVCLDKTEGASATWFDANQACMDKKMRLPRLYEWIKICQSGNLPTNDQWASALPVGYYGDTGDYIPENSDTGNPITGYSDQQGMGALVASGSCTNISKVYIHRGDYGALPTATYRCVR